jgi:hypothetical protein
LCLRRVQWNITRLRRLCQYVLSFACVNAAVLMFLADMVLEDVTE